MDLTAERIARNDATFRDANEQIEAAAAKHGVSDRVPFLCECADLTCTEILQLSLVDYETVRSQPRWFLNAPGHQVAAGPHAEVVLQRATYVVVEKVGRAGEVAEELDAREQEDADARQAG